MKKTYSTPLIATKSIEFNSIMLSVSNNVNIKVSTNPRDIWSAR